MLSSGWGPCGLPPGHCGHGLMELIGFGRRTSFVAGFQVVSGFQMAEIQWQEFYG